MNKYFILHIFSSLLAFLVTFSLSAQQVVEQISAETCACIEKASAEESIKSLELLTNSCVQQAMLENITGITETYRADLSDPEASREVGQSIGKEVGNWLAENCVSYRALQTQSTQSKPKVEMLSFPLKSTEGSITELRGEELGFVILVDEYGDELSFLWLEKFTGSDEFLGRIEDLKGRRVKIIWREIQLYQVRTQNYRKSKEIRGIELLD